MKKRITIQDVNIANNKLLITAGESLEGLHPSGQLLVDSENFAFIYLMEGEDDYTYIVIPAQVWPLLKIAQDQTLPVWITFADQQIELIDFHEEFEYVIGNIKGNSNYGKEMVARVEGVFYS